MESLHVSIPHESKSRPITSPTNHGSHGSYQSVFVSMIRVPCLSGRSAERFGTQALRGIWPARAGADEAMFWLARLVESLRAH